MNQGLKSGIFRDSYCKSATPEQKHKKKELAAKSSEELREIFFRLIEEKNGQITVLQMSKEANLGGDEAKDFLDQRAVEFDAHFETNETGGIIYKFPY